MAVAGVGLLVVEHPYAWSGTPIQGGEYIETADGEKVRMNTTPFQLGPAQIGGWIQYAGYRLHVPPRASLHWPALSHNPYRRAGQARTYEGRIEVRLPSAEENLEHRLRLEVLE